MYTIGIIAWKVWSKWWYSTTWSWVLYLCQDHTLSVIISIVYERTVLLQICTMLYSQLFARNCLHELHVIVASGSDGCWLVLSATARTMLLNKLKKFNPDVFIVSLRSADQVGINMNAICSVTLLQACKGQFYNFPGSSFKECFQGMLYWLTVHNNYWITVHNMEIVLCGTFDTSTNSATNHMCI